MARFLTKEPFQGGWTALLTYPGQKRRKKETKNCEVILGPDVDVCRSGNPPSSSSTGTYDLCVVCVQVISSNQPAYKQIVVNEEESETR